jgi:hypothetical protein
MVQVSPDIRDFLSKKEEEKGFDELFDTDDSRSEQPDLFDRTSSTSCKNLSTYEFR